MFTVFSFFKDNSKVTVSEEDLQDAQKLETIAEDKGEEVDPSPPPS